MSQPVLTDAQQALLAKLRKGRFAGLTVKKFADLTTVLSGWSIRPATGYLGCSNLSWLAERDFGKWIGTDVDASVIRDPAQPGMLTREATDAFLAGRLIAYTYDAAEAEAVRAWLATLVVDTLPNAADRAAPAHVVTQLGAIRPRRTDAEYGTLEIPLTFLVRTPYHVITAPDGRTFDLVLDTTRVGYQNARTFDRFGAWAMAETDLLTQVNALLGTEPHVAKKDRPRADLEENVGTCGVCCGQFKITPEKQDVLVNHGYQRPGIGYLVGACPGVGFQPYELSAKACEVHLEWLDQEAARVTARLEALTTGQVTTLMVKRPRVGLIEISPTDTGWADALRHTVAEAERLARAIAEDQATMRQRIADWVPHPEHIKRPDGPELPPAVRLARRFRR